MGGTASTLAAIVVLAAAATSAQAAVSVTQNDGDLYVVGGNKDDSVRIVQTVDSNYRVLVVVYDSGTRLGTYRNVDKVWVDTGNGDDDVEVDYHNPEFAYPHAGGDICIHTGDGDDEVDIDANYLDNTIDVSTGKGDDYVHATAYTCIDLDGEIAIDTADGNDHVCLSATSWNGTLELSVALGRGDDEISGAAYSCDGTVDGGDGEDSCSVLYVYLGSLEVIDGED